MLQKTDVPLFFLLAQLLIAVVLFVLAHAMNLLVVPIRPDWEVYKGLAPLIVLNVIGLRFVHHSSSVSSSKAHLVKSLGNYTLKYVDASFYQVARGLVLPFTVGTSYFLLNSRPSLRIIFACGVVTAGFFVGVFLDGAYVSPLGIFFGVTSSLTTSLHAVVIKRSLDIVKNNALNLSWYTNLLSAGLLMPLIVLAGEGPAVMKLFSGTVGNEDTVKRFIWGSIIAVRILPTPPFLILKVRIYHSGHRGFPDEHRESPFNQSHIAHHPHGFIRRPRRRSLLPGRLALPRYNDRVRLYSSPFPSQHPLPPFISSLT